MTGRCEMCHRTGELSLAEVGVESFWTCPDCVKPDDPMPVFDDDGCGYCHGQDGGERQLLCPFCCSGRRYSEEAEYEPEDHLPFG